MVNPIVRILRSFTTAVPNTLPTGALAYSFVSNTIFVGDASNTAIAIGGNSYTRIIDNATQESIPNTLVLRDNNGLIRVGQLTAFSVTSDTITTSGVITAGSVAVGNLTADNITGKIDANNIVGSVNATVPVVDGGTF